MRTALSATAAAVAESCWLAALVVVPVFFNVHSFRTFEEDKIPLLRSLALVILVALVIRALEEGRQAWAVGGRPIWRLPLVAAALVLTGAYVLSTVCSIAPRLSVWGSYERTQGLYTWLSYVAVFVAIVLLIRTRSQLERLITVILLASVPPAVYAVLQHFGYDPITWGLDVTSRAHGTTGNPIFLSAYLIMVVPLTLVRTIDWTGRPPSEGIRATLTASAYLVLLALQLLAILYSGSRGPFLGLAVGVTFIFLILALRRRSRWLTVTVTGLTVGGAIFVALLKIDEGPLSALRELPGVARLGRLFETGGGTGKVRVVIWEGATNLLAANPARDLIGYGPETLFLAYTPFYPPELARYESRRVAPDRAHNETFDALITTGVFGCAAQCVFFVALFYSILKWLSLITTTAQRRLFMGTALVGAVAGGLGPYLLDASFRFSGLGLPLGIVVGLVVYLLAVGLGDHGPPATGLSWRELTLLGLLGALLGHFVEIQFGIAVSITRLLFWVYAGIAIVIGFTLKDDEHEAACATPETGEPGYGLTVGLLLVILTFDFYRPDVNLSWHRGALLALVLSTWTFGAIVSAADTSRPFKRMGRYSAASFVVWFVFSAIYIPWLNWRPSLDPFRLEQVLPAGKHLANCLSILYMSVFAIVALGTVRLVQQWGPSQQLCRRTWHLGMAVLLLAASVPVIVLTNVDVSRADIFLKQIAFYSKQQRLDGALLVANEALRLESGVSQYTTALVRVLMDLARTQPEQRALHLAQAQAALTRIRTRDPLNMDNTRNLARLHRLWSGLATDATEQQPHLDAADDYYAQATQLSPNNASLWNEWALLYTERRQVDNALRLLDHSLEIDDGYTTTWWMRANVRELAGAFELALADYDRALAINPKLLAAWSGKALALARLNRLADAIAANQEAARVAPNDLISHRNLALLYYQTGQPELARREAEAALNVAKLPKDKSDLEAFIRQVDDLANPG